MTNIILYHAKQKLKIKFRNQVAIGYNQSESVHVYVQAVRVKCPNAVMLIKMQCNTVVTA